MRWLALLGVVSAGCTSPLAALKEQRPFTTGTATFVLRWSPPDAAEPERVQQGLTHATPALARWGGLLHPVTVYVLPTHSDLEWALHRFGYDWLRAWAEDEAVLLQSPRTWGSPRERDLDELLTHELTHCLLFQRAGATWASRGIPMWFREGMATQTAHQAAKFPTLEDLASWVEAHPQADVFADGDELSRDSYAAVYGLSHHAFGFLLRRYGDRQVLSLLEALADGRSFGETFHRALGLSLQAFERDFFNYVRLRGYRGAGLPIHKELPTTH